MRLSVLLPWCLAFPLVLLGCPPGKDSNPEDTDADTDTDTDADTDADADPLPLSELAAGDLVLDELMVAPSAVQWSMGQWVEVYNTLGRDVDLDGLEIQYTEDATATS